MKEQKRAGNTKITSVSIPNDLLPIIQKHNISPTLALKKGIGVELFLKGVPTYQSQTNEERARFLSSIDKFHQQEQNMEELQTALRKILFDIEFVREKIKKIKEEDKEDEL